MIVPPEAKCPRTEVSLDLRNTFGVALARRLLICFCPFFILCRWWSMRSLACVVLLFLPAASWAAAAPLGSLVVLRLTTLRPVPAASARVVSRLSAIASFPPLATSSAFPVFLFEFILLLNPKNQQSDRKHPPMTNLILVPVFIVLLWVWSLLRTWVTLVILRIFEPIRRINYNILWLQEIISQTYLFLGSLAFHSCWRGDRLSTTSTVWPPAACAEGFVLEFSVKPLLTLP